MLLGLAKRIRIHIGVHIVIKYPIPTATHKLISSHMSRPNLIWDHLLKKGMALTADKELAGHKDLKKVI